MCVEVLRTVRADTRVRVCRLAAGRTDHLLLFVGDAVVHARREVKEQEDDEDSGIAVER
jgi:hypothetical protein